MDSKTESIYTQFMEPDLEHQGTEIWKGLEPCPFDSCPRYPALGKQEESESKQLRKVLLPIEDPHKLLEPEQSNEDLPGGLQKKNKMSLERVFVS